MLPPAPTLVGAALPPDFNVLAILKSFSKATACGPSGLRIQHLLNAAEVPLKSSKGALLRDKVNLLALAGFHQEKTSRGVKAEFILFRGGNYKANQITLSLQYMSLISCKYMCAV